MTSNCLGLKGTRLVLERELSKYTKLYEIDEVTTIEGLEIVRAKFKVDGVDKCLALYTNTRTSQELRLMLDNTLSYLFNGGEDE